MIDVALLDIRLRRHSVRGGGFPTRETAVALRLDHFVRGRNVTSNLR